MTLLALHTPPHARAPVATVADVAPWFTPPPWHHKSEPPLHDGSDEGDHMPHPDYEFGHGAELTNLRRRIGIDTQTMADMLRVRKTTLERWENDRENIHKDVLARARNIGTAQTDAITKLIDDIPAGTDRHEVTVHREKAADKWNQVVMLATLADPRIIPVLESGHPATLFTNRRRLGHSVSTMADVLQVRKTTYQRWEAGRDPFNPEVAARVDKLIADQEELVAKIVGLAHADDLEAIIYRDTDTFPHPGIDPDDWNQAVMLATVTDPRIRAVYVSVGESRRSQRQG